MGDGAWMRTPREREAVGAVLLAGRAGRAWGDTPALPGRPVRLSGYHGPAPDTDGAGGRYTTPSRRTGPGPI
jgi:hypothetical protein